MDSGPILSFKLKLNIETMLKLVRIREILIVTLTGACTLTITCEQTLSFFTAIRFGCDTVQVRAHSHSTKRNAKSILL